VGLSDAPLGSLVRNDSADLHVKEPKEDTSPIVLAALTRPSFTVGLALEGERAQGMPGEGLTHGPPAIRKAGGSHHKVQPSHPAFPAKWF
jgi:hypothetical protein